MKMSRRARRMERRHKRSRAVAALSLVSLMDIFTILVFFLLVHSSDAETLQSSKSIQLPESIAEKSPKPTIVITVGREDILVEGRKVASVAQVLSSGADAIDELKTELDYQATRRAVTKEAASQPRAITILADKDTSYRLIKMVMLTCVRASFENISLAVLKRELQG